MTLFIQRLIIDIKLAITIETKQKVSMSDPILPKIQNDINKEQTVELINV